MKWRYNAVFTYRPNLLILIRNFIGKRGWDDRKQKSENML